MGQFFLRGTRGTAGVCVLVGVLLSCTNQGATPAGQPAAARAAADRIAADRPADAGGEALDLAGLQGQFEQVARQISPSVVAISATEADFDFEAAARADELNPDRLAAMLATADRTVGTGFIIDTDGYILTNDHVVAHAAQLWITTDDRKVYPAMVVGSDPRADLAILKVPARGLPAVRWADPARLRRGQWSIAIGNPYGLAAEGEMCVSVGVVSAMGRSLPKLSGKEDRLYSDLIQTTAQINPGNSGGPLFDIHGDVIGINAAVILPQKQTNGIGFAIPANERVMRIVERLKAGEEVVYGYLGVRATTPTARERRTARIDEEVGALVDHVETDSPAAAAGLKRGDLVLSVNGEAVRDGDHFIRVVGSAPVTDAGVPATVVRGHDRREVTLKLRRREMAAAAVTRERQKLRWRGLLLGPTPANWSYPGRAPSAGGVVVLGVQPNSPFAKDGVAQGAVITAVAGKPVTGITELQSLLNDVPAEEFALQFAPQGDSVVVSIQE
ncbi:MAG: HtrA protease/chaperone protein [uncultured Phycisphaerae bacterium]|uniref:HtrA protease/chaperone protein n=1 Tax=uncultured Phycisphaerae bacterium TaxID=904963 RepID=A0A6J4P3W0_9BACT|nr:MAG: HtrA protease/chaperone protein [uncultured Phycisphaerae bacterium]